MKIGPKYKIARRLGAPVFEKTQTQKFALSESRHSKTKRRPRARTEFSIQMNEKQKARYVYGLSEKQFSNYVKEALAKKGHSPAAALFSKLESRLDNVAYRLGIAPTRFAARQMATHGHLMVNDRRTDIPSYRLKLGDVVSIRPGSLTKPLFAEIDNKIKEATIPTWLKMDLTKKAAKVEGEPKLEGQELLFDINAVLDFYSR